MKVISLETLTGLFKDAASLKTFAGILQAEDDSVCAVVFEHDVVCTVMGPEAMREVVQDRFLKRCSEDPGLLDELGRRLDSDDLVD